MLIISHKYFPPASLVMHIMGNVFFPIELIKIHILFEFISALETRHCWVCRA